MIGAKLVGYGAYLPRYRLQRGKTKRAVASYDEDAITMAVGAVRRLPDSRVEATQLYLATSTPPFWDKSNAGTVHAASGLRDAAYCVDVAGLRSGFDALRLASQSGGIAVMSDLRTGRPGSAEEQEGGDGAAAFLFASEGDAIAEIVATVSLPTEVMDIWRQPGARWSSTCEERFASTMSTPVVREAVTRLGLEAPPTWTLVSALNGRFATTTSASFKPVRGTDLLQAHRGDTGYCGAADPGLLLARALDEARAGDTILLVAIAGGADAMLLHVLRDGAGSKSGLEPLALDYVSYLTWRGLLEREPARRPERASVAAPASFRNRGWKFGLQGSRCTACEAIHLPPQRVCSNCHAVDASAPYDASGRSARIAAFSSDLVSDSPAPPAVAAMIDFEGGGRVMMELAEAKPGELVVGDPVQITFRRTYEVDATPNYFWKARPSKRASA